MLTAILLLQCLASCHQAHPKSGRMHSPFRKLLHGSLGSIPLLPRYFISAGFSPPAANFYFARRPPHLGCIHLAAAIAHSSLISQSIAKVHLHSSATFVPFGKYTSVASNVAAIAPDDRCFPGSPFVGARRPPPFSSFLLHSGGRTPARCSELCFRVTDKVPIQYFIPCFLQWFELTESLLGRHPQNNSGASSKMKCYVT